MQISSRFTIASHILVLLALEGEKEKQTSTSIAGSVGVNPVIIRNILSQLKEAGLVEVARGVGGARLAQDPDQITLCMSIRLWSYLEKRPIIRFS